MQLAEIQLLVLFFAIDTSSTMSYFKLLRE